jgi:serine protease
MKTAWVFPTAALMMAGAAWAPAQQPRVFTGNLQPRSAEYVPGRVVVGFKSAVTDAEATQIVAGAGQGTAIRTRGWRHDFDVLSVPRGRVWAVVNALRKDPRVRYAHPDWIAHALQAPPNDPYYPLQWNLRSGDPLGGDIRAEGAWAVDAGGDPSVTVAVVDTGIAYEAFGNFCRAPDLAGAHFVPGWDFVNGDAHPNDDNSHGTHVAGTIAQTTNNALGVAGIAYNVSLMPVKVLDATGSGSVSQIADGIRWAADNGADVINMSLGTSAPATFLTALQDAVQYAASQGVVIVASAGNAAGATPEYPAGYPEVIAVGATEYGGQMTSYSNRGVEVCAPGGTDAGTDANGDGYPDMILQNTFDPNTRAVCDMSYWFFAGTSMASPHVAALAALVKSEAPSLTATEIRQVIRDTANPAFSSECGYGLIDATLALETVATGDHPPVVSLVSPPAGAMVHGDVTVRISASDSEDATGTLEVEWSRNGGPWETVPYVSGAGDYEVGWNTTLEGEDSTVTLRARATDSIGQVTEATPLSVVVNNDNQPPKAAFTYSCSVNVCSFDGSGSSDPDGTALSYGWTFGDGQSGAGQTVVHTFTAGGDYTVALTVTDELGLPDAVSENITVEEPPRAVHVSDLDGSSRRVFWGFWQARITIRVADTAGKAVSNAGVTGLFSDGPSLFQCTTGGGGSCSVVGYQWSLPCLTFTVTNVSHATLQYDPSLNTDPDGDSNGTRITVCRP